MDLHSSPTRQKFFVGKLESCSLTLGARRMTIAVFCCGMGMDFIRVKVLFVTRISSPLSCGPLLQVSGEYWRSYSGAKVGVGRGEAGQKAQVSPPRRFWVFFISEHMYALRTYFSTRFGASPDKGKKKNCCFIFRVFLP